MIARSERIGQEIGSRYTYGHGKREPHLPSMSVTLRTIRFLQNVNTLVLIRNCCAIAEKKEILPVDKRWKGQHGFPVFRAASICVIQPTPWTKITDQQSSNYFEMSSQIHELREKRTDFFIYMFDVSHVINVS